MDFSKLDTATLHKAESGNMKPLIQKLRSGGWITDQERQFIADRLEGKRQLKRGPKSQIQKKDMDVYRAYEWLTEVEKCAIDAAKEIVAEKIGESARNVRNRLERAESVVSQRNPPMGIGSMPLWFLVQHALLIGNDPNDLQPELLRKKKP